uniref:Uncharacterized protein n=1 Tax=Variovorax paradoxus (strain S110) TaxID=543728 RepID=C5CX43_VARPS
MRGGCLSFFGGSFFGGGRVSPRRATYFSLLRQRNVGKRKATLLSASLRFAAGNLRCSITAGVRRTRSTAFRSNSCGPDPASICAPRRIQKGWERAAFASLGPKTNSQYQQPNPIPTTTARSAAVAWWPSEAKARLVSNPLCMRRGAECFADQGSPLFERSEFGRDPAKREHRRLPRSVAKGSQTVGSPFFCLRFFGEAKKSRSPAGARPGLGKQTISTDQKIGSDGKAASPHPNPLPEGEGVSQK